MKWKTLSLMKLFLFLLMGKWNGKYSHQRDILIHETLLVFMNHTIKCSTFSLMRPSETENNLSFMRLFPILTILKYLNPLQVHSAKIPNKPPKMCPIRLQRVKYMLKYSASAYDVPCNPPKGERCTEILPEHITCALCACTGEIARPNQPHAHKNPHIGAKYVPHGPIKG